MIEGHVVVIEGGIAKLLGEQVLEAAWNEARHSVLGGRGTGSGTLTCSPKGPSL
jgi:hypothetical protein